MREKQSPRIASSSNITMRTTKPRAPKEPTGAAVKPTATPTRSATTTARATTRAAGKASTTTRGAARTTASSATRAAREKPATRDATTETEASESLGPPPPSARPLRRASSNITTDAEEVRRLRTQLQSMKEQVVFMHRMMKGLSLPERRQLPRDDASTSSSVSSKRLSFAGMSPVKKTRGSVDVLVMPGDEHPFEDEPQWTRPVGSAATELSRDLASKLETCQLQNASLAAQVQQHKQLLESTKAEYEAQLEDAAAKLAVIDAENLQLHEHVQEYEEENLRLHAALAEMGNNDTMASLNQDASDLLDDELGIEGLGPEPQDAHERCDAKIHELWQTIKTLKAYVETFRVENEDLRVQRDTATASAERAWQENSKLAGNNNPQQKIKYVEILKQENADLTEQVRELQSKLTKKQFKGKRKGKGSSASSASEPLDEYPSMESADDHSDDGSYEERTKLLKKMWARNKKLEEEIVRLQKEKQALVMRQPRSPSADSKQSRPSSQASTTRSTTRSTPRSTPRSNPQSTPRSNPQSTPPRSNPQSTTSSRWKK